MLQSRKKQPKTLADKMSDLLARPTGSDSSAEESQDEATAPRIVDFEDEYALPEQRSTDIRKRNVKLLSEQSMRYRGKIASRKDFAHSDEDEQLDASEQSSNESEEEQSEKDEDDVEETDEEDNEDDEEEEQSDGEHVNDFASDASESENGRESNIMSARNTQAEMQKGLCVQNQLYLWERLLELRIHTQKLLSKANDLPTPNEMQQIVANTEWTDVVKENADCSSLLMNSLLQLQTALFKQFSELKSNMRNTLKRALPADAQEVPASKRYAEHLQNEFSEFRTYRNQVLLKWDDRTKLLTPGAGAKKKSMQEDFDILHKIENALTQKNNLLAKTQMRRQNDEQQQTQQEQAEEDAAADAATNAATQQQRNVNIYDDSDFYHQQLRELIEYKANCSSNMSEITNQYVELQKLRQKMKKQVDTRASKGRKLRYVVHNKLINFMAPNDVGTWTNESKDELFRSLFKAN